ncbi:50S ribosomal protein L6 [bacterium]|nr:50S ribosomal protein L6 [bacterium]
MSRVGKQIVRIPKGVTVQLQNGHAVVKGPKGSLQISVPPDVTVKIEGDTLKAARASEADDVKARHGLAARLLQNAVRGVSEGFTRELEIVGVGYRAAKQGAKLVLTVGYTKPVEVVIPKAVEVTVDANTRVVLKGPDRHELGQLAANIRAVRPPEVYQGKGIRYFGERIRKKAGKATSATSGGGGAKK